MTPACGHPPAAIRESSRMKYYSVNTLLLAYRIMNWILVLWNYKKINLCWIKLLNVWQCVQGLTGNVHGYLYSRARLPLKGEGAKLQRQERVSSQGRRPHLTPVSKSKENSDGQG